MPVYSQPLAIIASDLAMAHLEHNSCDAAALHKIAHSRLPRCDWLARLRGVVTSRLKLRSAAVARVAVEVVASLRHEPLAPAHPFPAAAVRNMHNQARSRPPAWRRKGESKAFQHCRGQGGGEAGAPAMGLPMHASGGQGAV